MNQFKLTIDMSNDAMRDKFDLLMALKQVMRGVSQLFQLEGNVRDANGNTVGRWTIT